jgi:hypothetical protein
MGSFGLPAHAPGVEKPLAGVHAGKAAFTRTLQRRRARCRCTSL